MYIFMFRLHTLFFTIQLISAFHHIKPYLVGFYTFSIRISYRCCFIPLGFRPGHRHFHLHRNHCYQCR